MVAFPTKEGSLPKCSRGVSQDGAHSGAEVLAKGSFS